MFWQCLYSTIRLSNTSRLGHVRTYSSRSWAVGAGPGAESSLFRYSYIAYRLSPRAGALEPPCALVHKGWTMSRRQMIALTAVNPLPALHAALPLVPSLYHLRYTSASRLPTQPTPHM